jgi:cell wall-associated NlpC family hydrolase
LSGLLGSSNLVVSSGVRSWLEGGGVDPRAVSVLDQVLVHYQVGLGSVEVASDPVPVQELVITSVDGQAVGPDNFAARDLVTEIAAMDPGVRPDVIGTPWPIQSQGFFSDGSSVSSLRLGFELPGTNASAAEVAGYAGASPVEAAGQSQMAYAAGAEPVATAAPQAEYPAGTYPVASSSGAAQQAEQLAGAAAPLAQGVSPGAEAKMDAMVKFADAQLGKPYIWGGGHDGWGPQPGYDCSGFVSAVLHSGGYLNEPVTSSDLAGQPGILSGPGKLITIYDRDVPDAGGAGHVIIDINGQFYESGGEHGYWGGGGGVEKIGRPSAAYLATFERVLHPEGM